MSTTVKQNNDFISSLAAYSTLLDDAISWIASNMAPENVFSVEDLSAWAIANGYVLAEQRRPR